MKKNDAIISISISPELEKWIEEAAASAGIPGANKSEFARRAITRMANKVISNHSGTRQKYVSDNKRVGGSEWPANA